MSGIHIDFSKRLVEKGGFYEVYENIIPENLLVEIIKEVSNLEFKSVESIRGYKSYSMSLVNTDKILRQTTNLKALGDYLTSEPIKSLLEDRFNVKLSGEAEQNLWKYEAGNYLGPHLDKESKIITFLLYLNPEWKAAWGGDLFLYDNHIKKTGKSVLPTLNKAVFLRRTNNSWHEVKPVKKNQKSRVCYQLIFR